MDFRRYAQTYKRTELGRCWFHMTTMTLVCAQERNRSMLLVIEGAEREDDDGRVTSDPVILGKVGKKDLARAVGELLIGAERDVGIEGEYQWDLVKGPQSREVNALWSICWTRSDADPDRMLGRFLLRMRPESLPELISRFPDPEDHLLLEIACLSAP